MCVNEEKEKTNPKNDIDNSDEIDDYITKFVEDTDYSTIIVKKDTYK